MIHKFEDNTNKKTNGELKIYFGAPSLKTRKDFNGEK